MSPNALRQRHGNISPQPAERALAQPPSGARADAPPSAGRRHSTGECLDGRYEIRELLGEGGMAEVYRAIDSVTGKDVVVKLPYVEVVGDLTTYGRFVREMEIAQGLDHPGLQRLLSKPRSRYMVLEYVEGEPLRRYLAARGQLPIDQVVQIGLQLAETLRYVHEQGIVHRDLKPDNILIGPDGKVTLADFGIALKFAARRLTFSNLSNTVGTPDYMAPEQVRGQRGDARTDIYGLGAVLYELLTGQVPFPTDDKLDAVRRKAQTEPVLVRRLRPDVPLPLEAVIYRALRRKPEERYASATLLAHDLAHLDEVVLPDNYAVDVPPPEPLGDLPPWRTTLPILAIVLGALTVFGFVAELLHRNVAPR